MRRDGDGTDRELVRAADPLNGYWNELAKGGAAVPGDLDRTFADAVRRLHGLDQTPALPTRLRARMWEDLMSPYVANAGTPRSPSALTTATNGRTPIPWPPPAALPPWPSRRHWAPVSLVAVALLLLALTAGYLAVGPRRLGLGDDPPARLPAIGTPDPGPPVALVWETKGGPGLPLGDPTYLAVDPQGNVWVPDGLNSRFQIFAPDGAFLAAWGTFGAAEGQFDFMHPGFGGYGQGGAAFDAAGNLYVADTGNHRVQKFGPDRRFLTAWGGEGRADGQFDDGPTDVAVDAQGRVYVVDAGRGDVPNGVAAIQVFDGNGRFLAAWGDPGQGDGQLVDPIGLAIDGAGNVWVADFNNNRVQKFSPDGAFLAAWGEAGSGPGQFTWPTDVAVDGRGRVYVTDWLNDRVQVFEPDGRFLAEWGNTGPNEPGWLNGPNSVAFDGAGNVYVAEVGGDRVEKFRLLPPLAP